MRCRNSSWRCRRCAPSRGSGRAAAAGAQPPASTSCSTPGTGSAACAPLPAIAIVDWHDVPTVSEFRLSRDYFQSMGCECVITTPDALSYETGKLRDASGMVDRPDLQAGADPRTDRGVRARAPDGSRCRGRRGVHGQSVLLQAAAQEGVARRALRRAEPRASSPAASCDAIARHVPWTRVVEERHTTMRRRARSTWCPGSATIAMNWCSSPTTITAAPASCWAGKSTRRVGDRGDAGAHRAVHRAATDRAAERAVRRRCSMAGWCWTSGLSTPRRSAGTAPGRMACSAGFPPRRSSMSRPAADRRCRHSSWSLDEGTLAHHRHRRGIPDHRPGDARTAQLHHRDPAGGFRDARRDQAGTAPVDGRDRHARSVTRRPRRAPSWSGSGGW